MSAFIFDRKLLASRQRRAAVNLPAHDFLLREMADRLADRLHDTTRHFPLALDLGTPGPYLAQAMAQKSGIERCVKTAPYAAGSAHVVADEEMLPFAPESFDLVVSAGNMHWVNDLPGALAQIKRILKPEGLFLCIMPGGETLTELRQSFERAELRYSGGISPRVSPFIDVPTAGALLMRATFALPVVDSETLRVEYEHPLKLLKDLRGMGETNALVARKRSFTPCSVLMGMADDYMQHFSNVDGRVVATVELITLTGWKS